MTTLPLILVGFLTFLAASTLAHVLAAAVRRRRHELAVYRALGFTRRMIRTVLRSQGTTIGLVGLVIGLPLGLAAGRLGWRWVADQVPLQFVAPFAAVLTLLVVPTALVIAVLLAVLPGLRATRLRPGEALRAE
ncbi:MAG: FtsX-like permease family protein [Acidimicrobiales bacterium]